MNSYKVERPHCNQRESFDMVWNNHVFCVLKKLISVDNVMLHESARQGLFEPACGANRNAHF
jgi:hypothetical protein